MVKSSEADLMNMSNRYAQSKLKLRQVHHRDYSELMIILEKFHAVAFIGMFFDDTDAGDIQQVFLGQAHKLKGLVDLCLNIYQQTKA